MRVRAKDVVEISEKYIKSLSHHGLRALAVRLGALVQDNPDTDTLLQRIRQCQEV